MNRHINKHKAKQQKPRTEPIFNCDFKPWSKSYKLAVALHMLTYCQDFSRIKKISGVSIAQMLRSGIVEWYSPFDGVKWLRRRVI